MKRKIMPGSLVQIDLGVGVFAYGQAIGKTQIGFFDYFGQVLQNDDLRKLCSHKVIFVLSVMDSAIKSGRWIVVGSTELRAELKIPRKYFIQDAISKAFSVYHSDTGNVEPASASDIDGLECAAVWEADHVEDRLRDYRAGKPNIWVQQLSPKPIHP